MSCTKNTPATSRSCVISKRVSFCLASLVLCSAAALAQTEQLQPQAPIGPNGVIVHSKFGGQIFGFDIDQNGSEGLLAESKSFSNGVVLAAVETFDQATGNILDIVQLTSPAHTQDDFVHGRRRQQCRLFEHEHVSQLFVSSRTFGILNPLEGNRVTGAWTPPIGSQHIIMPTGVSRSQGVPNVAVFAYDNSGQFIPYVFSSNVANNLWPCRPHHRLQQLRQRASAHRLR